MENLLLCAVLVASGLGALASGLVFVDQKRRLAMLLVCVVIFEVMLLIVGRRFEWNMVDERVVGLLGGFVLAVIALRIRRRDD